MDINLLVKITQRAWCLSILAQLHRGVPGRQAALLSATKAGRTALAQSLAHLIDIGLLERTPGHGHPLRPEYRLTAAGKRAAAQSESILSASPRSHAQPLLRRTWTLPILAVSHRPQPFSLIKAALPPITDRALSQSLKNLQAQEWLKREVDAQVDPPRGFYVSVNAGASISAAIAAT